LGPGGARGMDIYFATLLTHIRTIMRRSSFRFTGRHCLVALSLCALGAPGWSQTGATPPATQAETAPADATQASEAPATVTETILVTGQRPGPGLWKVSKGDHVLWVFGTYGPLPKNIEWRSKEVEAIVAQSQEYLMRPGANADVGFFRQMTMLPFAIGFKKNPDGAVLKDVLPEPVYARWLVLKKKYIGDDDGIERERPIFAAETLYRKGLEQAGLYGGGREVGEAIEKLVKKNKIKMTSTEAQLEVDDPVKMLRDFKKTPLDDVACFANTMARLEDDIDAMRVRANAWAKGDIEAIQKISYADREAACMGAVLNSALMQSRPGLKSVQARVLDSWVAAADKALAANASTFATLPLKDLLDPAGYVAALAAKGYVVEKPE
jgi:hypothetical protein